MSVSQLSQGTASALGLVHLALLTGHVGRVLEHWHGGTKTRHSQSDALYPEVPLELNEADAKQHGIKTGDVVRVSSRRGSVVLRARVTDMCTPGVVFIPMHFSEATAKIPECKACAASITLAKEEELANAEARTQRGRW